MKESFYKYATETAVLYNFMSCMEEGCSRCTLSDHNHKPIVYRGNPKADILLVGEAPGKVEQEEGKPFVGPAGILLNSIMSAIDLDTEKDMCITNSIYCRPTAPSGSGKENYTPKDDQITICAPFTHKLIQNIIKPKIIIACGRVALQQLMNDKDIRIGKCEGQWNTYKYSVQFPAPCRGSKVKEIPMFVMTHPAALLHMNRESERQKEKKKEVWKYMKYFRDSWKEKINV